MRQLQMNSGHRKSCLIALIALLLFAATGYCAEDHAKTHKPGAAGAGATGAARSANGVAGAVPAKVADAEEDEEGEEGEEELDEALDAGSPQGIQQQLTELRQQVEKLRQEAEARKRLEVSEEEKSKKAEDILSAAGREYTLLRKGALSLEYSLNYSLFSGDVIRDAAVIERRSNHNFTNLIFTEYGLKDNLSVNLGVPFVYKFNKVGTSQSQEATGFGDVTLGAQLQPLKAGGDMPALIVSAGASFPFGTSPYRINPETSLATGSGFYSVNGGVSLSKTMDPLLAFGNLSYNYSFGSNRLDQNWKDGRTLTSVDPGSSIGLAMGFGYALSYKASLNLSTQISYSLGSRYRFANAASYDSGSSVGASFNIGTGWRVTPTRSVFLKLGIGLTSNDPDFSLSVRVPFEM